jgi:hypothetical protein
MTTFWLWSSTPIPLNILRTHSVFPSAHVQLTVYHIWFHYKAAEQQTYCKNYPVSHCISYILSSQLF